MPKLSVICLILVVALPAVAGDSQVTDDFRLDKRRFTASGSNTYMSLNPGTRSAFILTTVLGSRRWVSFDDRLAGRIWVRTRVVEERKTLDGELVEISRRFFARCRQTSDIFYFGRERSRFIVREWASSLMVSFNWLITATVVPRSRMKTERHGTLDLISNQETNVSVETGLWRNTRVSSKLSVAHLSSG